MLTIKVKEDVLTRGKYNVYVLGSGDAKIVNTMKHEELIDFAQQVNNELAPIIGEVNLYERD